MISRAYLRELSAHNEWQNGVTFDLCEEIGEEVRREDRGMFFGSIHHTLDHVLMVDRAILTYLNSDTPPPSSYSDMIWPDWQELMSVRKRTDADLKGFAESWELEWLAGEADVRSPRMPGAKSIPRWLLVVQMFNHQTHHRSQVTAELHRLGLDYGSTDIPFRPGCGYFVD